MSFDIFDFLGITSVMEMIRKKPEQKVLQPSRPMKFIYRPQNLDEYIGQEKAKDKVKDVLKMIIQFKPCHILISGNAGMGKTSLANVISKQLDFNFYSFIGGSFTMENLGNFLEYNEKSSKPNVLFVDECLKKDSLIVLQDGGVKKIQDIYDDNLYMGNDIKNLIRRKTKKLYRINTVDGYLTTTKTHPHLAIKNNSSYQIINYAQPEIIKTSELKIGDYLISPKFIPHTCKTKWTKEQLAFIALTIADGCFPIGKYKIKNKTYKYEYQFIQYSFGKKEHFRQAKKIINKSVKTFKIKPSSISYAHNRDFVIRIYGRDFATYIGKTFSINSGNTKKYNTVINDEIFYAPLKSIEAFIRTLFLFEGWTVNNHTFIQMSSEIFLKQLQLLMKKFGIKTNLRIYKNKSLLRKMYRLKIITGSRSSFKYKNFDVYATKIQKIEEIELNEEVYDFTTKENIFVADSFVTHNCHNLKKEIAEFMYPIIEDFILPNEQNTKLRPFILIGATTEKSTLDKKFKPFVDRCGCQIQLENYIIEDIKNILKQYNNQIYKEQISEEVYQKIAENTRYTPRIAIYYLDIFMVNKNIDKVLKSNRIIVKGLTDVDIKILSHLKEIGKPVGEETLSIIGGIDRSDYRKLVEPYLLSEGYIGKVRGGRIILEKGKKLLEGLSK